MGAEFALIDRYFGVRTGAAQGGGIAIGIGDDCAALRLPPGHVLLTSVDTFTAGVHFFPGTDPQAIGHKALAVNLSDLAACGAQPLACLLALSLPSPLDEAFVRDFAAGFRQLAEASHCPLVGGDTTRSATGGGFSASVTVLGCVPDEASILRRSGARLGDDVWVGGLLGGAAFAVDVRRSGTAACEPAAAVGPDACMRVAFARLDWPEPQLALGQQLRGIASACIDVSDGLVADLGHVLQASGLQGALLSEASLPIAPELHQLDNVRRRTYTLYGGDDYVLCFTAPPYQRETLGAIAHVTGATLARIGYVDGLPGMRLVRSADQGIETLENRGYEHF